MNSLANLYAVFKTLQPELRAWIASDEAMAFTEAIARQFILSPAQERQIPILILRLVTQDIAPESFKAAIGERLAVPPDIAGSIARMIRETILDPVAQALRFGGVDADAIGFDAPAPPAPAGYGGQGISAAVPPEPMPPPAPGEMPAPTPSLPAPIRYGEHAPSSAAPFILHEEPKAARPEPVKPSFSFTPPPAPAGSGSQRAPKVIIERVVHYGALTTPLTRPAAQPMPKAPPASKWFS